MTKCVRSVDLPYAADDLFELVSDIRRYPEFVRWLRRIRIADESLKDNGYIARAEASVGFKGFSERFTTDVTADAEARSVNVKLVHGPFKRLTNSWKLSEIETGTRVEFEIDFEFRNFLLQALAATNLDFAIERLMQCFVDEAAKRYEIIDTGSA